MKKTLTIVCTIFLTNSLSNHLIFRQSLGMFFFESEIINENFNTFSPDVIRDVDGNKYKIVKIGSQWWMAENLRVSHYNDGTIIPTNLTDDDWSLTQEGAYAIYPYDKVDGIDSEEEILLNYGALYNWYAIENRKNLCPKGWHVPSKEEWTELVSILGGENMAGNKLKISDTTFWGSKNTEATNESGFSALPAGFRDYNGIYDLIGYSGIFWSSSKYKDNNTESSIDNDTTDLKDYYFEGNDCNCGHLSPPPSAYSLSLYGNLQIAIITNYSQKYGFSVRCVSD